MLEEILERLLRCPTAPFHEGYVLREILAICAEAGLSVRQDSWGNLRADIPGAGGKKAALLLVAHTDHPGFLVTEIRGRRLRARWWGGVRPEYFKHAAVRLYPYRPSLSSQSAVKQKIRGKILQVRLHKKSGRAEEIKILAESVPSPDFQWIGSWDFPEYSRRGNRLGSSHIDDVAGCAIALATLLSLRKVRPRAPVAALFTRAEEDGFHGALASSLGPLVSKKDTILSIETSARRPGIFLGKGPVVRMGDAAGVFHGPTVRWMEETARELGSSKKLRWQKRVMDGGTCEATAFGALGWNSCGLALPLAGYHNMGTKGRTAIEQVDTNDARGALLLLTELAKRWEGGANPKLSHALDKRRQKAPALLRKFGIGKDFLSGKS